ncbi:MAG: carbohydrate porin [Syntrophobacteraceae bacterium]
MISCILISWLYEVLSFDLTGSIVQSKRKIVMTAARSLVLLALLTAGALAATGEAQAQTSQPSTGSAQTQTSPAWEELNAQLLELREENARLMKDKEEAESRMKTSQPSTGSAQEQTSPPPAEKGEAQAKTSSPLADIILPIQLLGLQYNGVYQVVPPFRRPYSGPLSFGNKDTDYTETGGIYLGAQLTPRLQLYVDTEIFKGDGLSYGTGQSGFPNGDVVRAGSSNLPKEPYVARLYFRYICPLSSETEKVERCMDQLPGEQPVSRWEFKFGKLALTDDFDQNRYANNNRQQFMNYDFLYNLAWDYASDTRGYSYEALVALYEPKWRLAFAVAMEPNTQNGANYDWFNNGTDILRELGYNLEFDLKPNDRGTVLRFLTYFNTGRMGNFEDAILLGQATHTTPNILLVEGLGGNQYGGAFNFEQPLANDGETGIFGRLGWRSGSNEDWSYVECNWNASLGVQVSGANWQRPADRVGVAYGVEGLSGSHAAYLAAGGIGMLLGDGALNYGYEQVLEVYYSIPVFRCPIYGHDAVFTITPDFQFIQNPGYNSDRGPCEVYGLRARLVY